MWLVEKETKLQRAQRRHAAAQSSRPRILSFLTFHEPLLPFWQSPPSAVTAQNPAAGTSPSDGTRAAVLTSGHQSRPPPDADAWS